MINIQKKKLINEKKRLMINILIFLLLCYYLKYIMYKAHVSKLINEKKKYTTRQKLEQR